MLKIIKFSIFLLMPLGFALSAAENQHQHQHHSTSENIHVWNNAEKRLLKDLWIGSLPIISPNEVNNRYANNEKAISLGRKLFFDSRFSANEKISCAHCHRPELFFTDGKKRAKGLDQVKRNTPSIVGATYSQWLFHDGRADSLWAQALGPLEHPKEHGGNRLLYASILYQDKSIRMMYEKVFGPLPDVDAKILFKDRGSLLNSNTWRNLAARDKKLVTGVFVNMGKSIAAFESRLKPAASRFDRFAESILNNNAQQKDYLNATEIKGLKLFIGKAMCTMCHNGPMFSNFEFHNIGTLLQDPKQFDWGRYDGAQAVLDSEFNCRSEYNDNPDKSCKELDFIVLLKKHTVGSFKTPSLRNISKTAPYMHDGRYGTLEQVIDHYVSPPRGTIGKLDTMEISLNNSEKAQLKAFLLTLDGNTRIPGE